MQINQVSFKYKEAETVITYHCGLSPIEAESNGSESPGTEAGFTNENLSRDEMKIFLVIEASEIDAKQLIAFWVKVKPWYEKQ